MNGISTASCTEYKFGIEEGILICKVKPISNERYKIEIDYKPCEDYTISFSLFESLESNDNYAFIEKLVERVYIENEDLILDYIKEINEGLIKVKSDNISDLLYLVKN